MSERKSKRNEDGNNKGQEDGNEKGYEDGNEDDDVDGDKDGSEEPTTSHLPMPSATRPPRYYGPE